MRTHVAVAMLMLGLAGCGKQPAAVPPPVAIPADAIGHFCNMVVLDHSGPKGEIMVGGRDQPLWFSSARDAIAFTLLPEEAKDIRAIYVSDMGKSSSWERPEAWVEARQAVFVIGSNRAGGMGVPEAVPFSERAAADDFAARHGGTVVDFAHVPRDYILGGESGGTAPPSGATEHSHGR